MSCVSYQARLRGQHYACLSGVTAASSDLSDSETSNFSAPMYPSHVVWWRYSQVQNIVYKIAAIQNFDSRRQTKGHCGTEARPDKEEGRLSFGL